MNRAAAIVCAVLATSTYGAQAAAGMSDVFVSPEQQTAAAATWRYTLQRSTDPWPCGTRENRVSCVEQAVFIENSSPLTLECALRVSYKAADGQVLNSFETPALVLPASRARVHSQTIDANLHAEINRLSCKARAAYERLPKVAGCTYDMRGDPLETYYPEDAVKRSLEGPVLVAFLLEKKSGAAREVKVAESSLIPELDAAALRFMAGQRFTTNCPGTRFDVRVRFKLRDQVVAPRD